MPHSSQLLYWHFMIKPWLPDWMNGARPRPKAWQSARQMRTEVDRTDMTDKALPAGSVIGIIGGGQLGRMLAIAAVRLGYQTIILEPQADCPAAQTANRQIVAAYDDPAALAELAAACDVV